MAEASAIRGTFLPAPTPFTEAGEVDEATYAALLEHYVAAGVDALFVLGSFGQGATMDTPQRMRALEVALETVADRIPVVPDVGTVDPFRSHELATHARSHGVVALASVAPYYYTDRSAEEIVKHFSMIEEGIDLPLFLYNNPNYQGFNVTPPMMEQIREAVPQLTGMMHGGDSMSSILRYQDVLGPSFRIFASALNLYPGMLAGVAGSLAPPLAFAPEAGVALVAAIDRGDHEEALRLQLAVIRYLQRVGSLHRWFRGAQFAALRHLGFPVQRFPRWPTVEIPEEGRRAMCDAIDELRAAARPGEGGNR